MTASDRKNADADLQARTHYNSAFDRLFDSRVCTTCVAHTGNACINCILQVIHGIKKPHREGSDNIACDVHPLEHDVNMRVNETRQDVSAARVDLGDLTIRLVNITDVTNGMNPIFPDEYRCISQRCLPCAIDQRTVANQNVRHVDTSYFILLNKRD